MRTCQARTNQNISPDSPPLGKPGHIELRVRVTSRDCWLGGLPGCPSQLGRVQKVPNIVDANGNFFSKRT